MTHPLQRRVRALRRRAKGLLLVYAAACCAALTLSAALVVTFTDYALRWQHPAARITGALVVLGAFVWSFLRFCWPAIVWRPADVQVARHVERWRPQLAGRFSSALAFTQFADAATTAGSAELRSAVIDDAVNSTRNLRLADSLDTRAARLSAAAAFLLLAVAAGLFWNDRHSAQVALQRLAAPWIDNDWPRRNHLAFENPPLRIAKGDDLLLSLIDERGALPPEVFIEYMFDDGAQSPASIAAMTREKRRMTFQLDNVQHALKFRAFGGDDDAMPWLVVGVEEPPNITSLQLQLAPPAYTGWSVQSVENEFTALPDSRLAVTARVDRQLRSVQLRQGSQAELPTPVSLDDDRFGFSIDFDDSPAWAPGESGSYWFEIIDERGLSGGQAQRIDVRIVDDSPPNVAVQQPRGEIVATSSATLHILASLNDDLALENAELRLQRVDQPTAAEPTIEIPLTPPERKLSPQTSAIYGGPGDARIAELAWNLDQFEPGAVIEWRITAIDNKGQTGLSEPQRIEIVSSEQFADHAAAREALIRDKLTKAIQSAQSARAATAAVNEALAGANEIAPANLHRLQSADVAQRQVQETLAGDKDDAALALIDRLLADLQNNAADSSDAARRLQTMKQQVDELAAHSLPAIEQNLASALKALRIALESDANHAGLAREATSALQVAQLQQDETIFRLKELVGGLASQDNLRQIVGDLDEIEQAQRALRRTTGELRSATLARRWEELDADERAALLAAAQRQFELAQAMAAALERLHSAAASADRDSASAQSAAAALQAARRAALDSQMRHSAEHLRTNEVGRAATVQDQLLEQLAALGEMLADPSAIESSHSEQAAALADGLKSAVSVQQDLLDQTTALDKQRATQAGNLTTEQSERVRDLAARQSGASQTVRDLSDAAPAVFRAVLTDAAADMAAAGTLLSTNATGDPTQRRQQLALERLQQLVAAAQPPSTNEQPAPPDDNSAESPGEPPREENAPQATAAELRLLQIMQSDLRIRTTTLDELRRNGAASPAELNQQQTDLGADQQRLAELTEQLAQPISPTDASRPSNRDSSAPRTPAQPPDKSSLDLLEGLKDVPPPAAPPAVNPPGPPAGEDIGAAPQSQPLDEIGRRMRLVASSLARGDASPAVQDAQQQIADALAALAAQQEQLEAQQRAQQSSSTGQGRGPGEAPASTNNTAGPSEPPADASEAVKQIWGHLPPEVRERAASGDFSEFLPQYERMIEDYYRRLAAPDEAR